MLDELKPRFLIAWMFLFCFARKSSATNEEKGTFVPEFLSLPVNILSCETHINIAVGDCTVWTGNHL